MLGGKFRTLPTCQSPWRRRWQFSGVRVVVCVIETQLSFKCEWLSLSLSLCQCLVMRMETMNGLGLSAMVRLILFCFSQLFRCFWGLIEVIQLLFWCWHFCRMVEWCLHNICVPMFLRVVSSLVSMPCFNHTVILWLITLCVCMWVCVCFSHGDAR